MPYIYSTGTCDGTYVEYAPVGVNDGHARALKRVTIKGGHGVANKNLITPQGVVTEVSDDELEFLLKNDSFQKHMKDGFITVEKKKVDPEKKVKDMAKGDRSAPLTPDDFKEGKNSSPESRLYTGTPSK